MWADESIFYQIYTLGFCGAPKDNDGITVNRIKRVIEWTDYFSELGVDTIFFNPIFESDRHGYDTRDYSKLDCRLGTNEDFKAVCEHLHKNNFKIVLDGVFNHVGRGFWAFQDVLEKRENSQYKDWFKINFSGNNRYNDNLSYEAWEGCEELVNLNLKNPQVTDYLLKNVKLWFDEFDIDGIRLDVAYCLDWDFMKSLRQFCDKLDKEVFLVGEMFFGDYKQIVNPAMLHSATNYECYKGIYSSINSNNLFEISYSLNRQFSSNTWAIYKGLHLLSFVDNHDLSRIGTTLTNSACLPIAYAIMFIMPGIPCIYYGSEWAVKGDKKDTDYALRPEFEKPDRESNKELVEFIKQLIKLKKEYNKILSYGTYKNLKEANKHLVFEREYNGEKILLAVNIDSEFTDTGVYVQNGKELLSNNEITGNITLNPYEVKIIKL